MLEASFFFLSWNAVTECFKSTKLYNNSNSLGAPKGWKIQIWKWHMAQDLNNAGYHEMSQVVCLAFPFHYLRLIWGSEHQKQTWPDILVLDRGVLGHTARNWIFWLQRVTIRVKLWDHHSRDYEGIIWLSSPWKDEKLMACNQVRHLSQPWRLHLRNTDILLNCS